jgi:hypothetical protein
MRWLALSLLLFSACKKHDAPLGLDDPDKPPAADKAQPAGDDDDDQPKKKHHQNDAAADVPDKQAAQADAGSDDKPAQPAQQDDPPDKKPTLGGDGSPAFMDNDGHPHGPGGDVYMGRGADCDAAHDHCMRPGVYFQVDNIVGGKLFRALPVYELKGKWYDWGNGVERTGKFLKTKLATLETLHVGDPVVFFNTPQPPQWANSEYDGLTSSNWEVAMVSRVNSTAKTFSVQGWDDPFTIGAGRVVVETK